MSVRNTVSFQIGCRASARLQGNVEVAKHLRRLGGKIILAHQIPIPIERGLPRDEYHATSADLDYLRIAGRRAEFGRIDAGNRRRYCHSDILFPPSSPAMTNGAQSIARRGDRRRTQADGLLRLQRPGVERQSGHQEKTDKIKRIGLRRRDRPSQKSSDRCHRIAVVFHAAVLLDTGGNWKGQIRSALTASPPSSAARATP